MKKILLIAMSLCLFAGALSAQEEGEYIYMTPAQMRADARQRAKEWRLKQREIRPHYPWVLSVGGGAEVFMGENDLVAGYSEVLSVPALEASLSKWLLPWVGIGVSVSGSQFLGISALSTDPKPFFATSELVEVPGAYDTYYRQNGQYVNGHLDLMFNLFNLFDKSKMFRTFNVYPYVGFGLVHDFEEYGPTASTVNAGLIGNIRVSDALSFNLTVRGFATHDGFDGEYNPNPDVNSYDAMVSATAGLSFSFGYRKKPAAPAADK